SINSGYSENDSFTSAAGSGAGAGLRLLPKHPYKNSVKKEEISKTDIFMYETGFDIFMESHFKYSLGWS
ncbi:MAG: hypothetical protein Q8M56_18185, partial [Desulfobacterales bacterium]|nr:hypothetical protein [Desulfobacterales bacterium]